MQEQICSSPANQDAASAEACCLPYKKQKQPDSSPAGVLVNRACQNGASILHEGLDGLLVALQHTPGIDDAQPSMQTD